MIDTDTDADELPQIRLGDAASTIRTLTQTIADGILPDVYVTNGALVGLSQVSGDVDTAGDGSPLPVRAETLSVDSLTRLLAHHTHTFRRQTKDDGSTADVPWLPPARVLASILSRRWWPGVRPLYGVVGSPVLRPDGSLLQSPGYDEPTGLYLAPKVTVPTIPTRPSRGEVIAARRFVLREFLGDFPWVAEADKANYVGLLVAQILRPYLRTITPFGMVSATTQSSGKTLLTEGIGLLYGQNTPTWGRDDAELRKVITAMLGSAAAVIVWDNLKEGTAIDSPVLAQLLTSPSWSDRTLGSNRTFTAANDRLWLATGNNLRIGGDMATRTVLVRLDPKMPRPELRTNFTIPNLDQWIKDPDNRVTLLRHLLILAVDWIAHGAPRSTHTMRQFTTWAAATGGFLNHHGIRGFLDNAEVVRELDDEDEEWVVFLARWAELYGDRELTANELRVAAEIDYLNGKPVDRWDGRFITDDAGRLPTVKSLGRRLRGQIGRPHGDYALTCRKDSHRRCQVWSVVKVSS
ncbi:hypothetical protein JQS43_24475 [Natronosporangium hydrolyticum]|uniref:Uncharacterized protein n=1 Tax=Natronosporangium hydrolyticum TaxID=2811111 RepID=A0A895YGG2_9ACTN|nr:hypothetical protein [Natronosporangium hydrolyticum]QSB14589.1 hypothetical protein JQS43_24475 [Natronosporangium hydrolyticum]